MKVMATEEYHLWVDIEKHTIDKNGDEDWESIGMTVKLATYSSYEEAEAAQQQLSAAKSYVASERQGEQR